MSQFTERTTSTGSELHGSSMRMLATMDFGPSLSPRTGRSDAGAGALTDRGRGMVVATRSTMKASLSRPNVVAALLDQNADEPWREELTTAIENDLFVLPRTELLGVSLDAAARWLDHNLPVEPVSRSTRDALISEILDLIHLTEHVTDAPAYRVRLLTEIPNQRCGFHVDTVRPGQPQWGVLRVHNGCGTLWVSPDDVRSTTDFYTHLHNRECLTRSHLAGVVEGDDDVQALDDNPAFVAEDAVINVVPSGTTVVFRHLPADKHWSDHAPDSAWIHCSPMRGKRRLVINISPEPRATTR